MASSTIKGPKSVSVTSDGVKTWSQMLDSLYALIDRTKLTNHSVLKVSTTFYQPMSYQSGGDLDFSFSIARSNVLQIQTITLKSSGSVYITNNAMIGGANVSANNSSIVASSGIVFTLVY